MAHDRLTSIRVQNMRSICDATLALDGLTVLIGENGAGKSTLVEALELLRKAPRQGAFLVDTVSNFHNGLASLMRAGASNLTLAVTIEGAGPKMEYGCSFGLTNGNPEVRREWLDLWERGDDQEPLHVLQRDTAKATVFDQRERKPVPVENVQPLGLVAESSRSAFAQPALRRLAAALESIEVHAAWDTRPRWTRTAALSRTGALGMRDPVLLEEAQRLDPLGGNLPNRLATLRNSDAKAWTEVIELARLGLGSDLADITVPARGSGCIGLQLAYSTLGAPVPETNLSDGQLAFLAFVALAVRHAGQSIVVFDEPETHLHPALVSRLTWLLEKLGGQCPVLVATHSDALLDALSEPTRSAVLCSLDDRRATKLLRPDAAALDAWLTDYRGIGQLRAEGFQWQVFVEGEEPV